MAKISRQVKEAVQVVVFLVVVGALVIFYVINPLTNTRTALSRTDDIEINPDSLPPNDPIAFVDSGFIAPDTFRVETDGVTNVAGVYIAPAPDSGAAERGTVVLLHEPSSDRQSMIPLARKLVDSGFAVITYDQRASGLSTGKYHSDGRFEALDLQEVIAYLDLREKISHPLCVVGFSVGGDAALMTVQEESRIDRILAVDPYLTSNRMIDLQKQRHEFMWFPFYRTVMWWWFGIRSGYSAEFRDIDQLGPVMTSSLILLPAESLEGPEASHLIEASGADKLQIKALPDSEDDLTIEIMAFLLRE